MNIEILDRAADDLIEGFRFYEEQEFGIGEYFLSSLEAEIESLRIYAGIHRKTNRRYHRLIPRRFPFAIFYTVSRKTVYIHAILDCRRDPQWIRKRLA